MGWTERQIDSLSHLRDNYSLIESGYTELEYQRLRFMKWRLVRDTDRLH